MLKQAIEAPPLVPGRTPAHRTAHALIAETAEPSTAVAVEEDPRERTVSVGHRLALTFAPLSAVKRSDGLVELAVLHLPPRRLLRRGWSDREQRGWWRRQRAGSRLLREKEEG
jgi:hypothetical protein